MKRILLFVVFLMVQFGFGQTSIWTNPITGTNPSTSNPYTTGQTVDPNITVSGIGRGNGIIGNNTNDRYDATGWNSGSFNAIDHFQFTITPNSGYKINLSSLVYTGTTAGGGSGPTNYVLRSSIDGYTANIGTGLTNSSTVSLSGATFQDLTSAVTFRLYAWGASSATRRYGINDFTFNGTVVPLSLTPTTSVGTYQFCIDNTNTQNTSVALSGQFATVNIIKGYTYSFSVGDAFTAYNERLTLLDMSNNQLPAPITSTGASGASINNWIAKYSGQIKVVLSNENGPNGLSGGAITLSLNAIGNIEDDPTIAGTDTWRGHIYNWSSASSPSGIPGGSSSPTTPTATTPFSNAEYAGYYDIDSPIIDEKFKGNTECFSVFSDGGIRAQIYTEQFAIRYRMKSTLAAGCYIATFRADDGVRLYVDDIKVYDEWKIQPPTPYGNVLIYLNGNSDLIFDYYENAIENEVAFSLIPFDKATNTITAPTPATVCSGVTPGVINGSSYTYSGSTINPTLKYQWQTATSDSGPWSNVTTGTSGTAEDYTPASITTTGAEIRYYRRLVSATAVNASACTWESNVISITTGANVTPGAPTSSAATNISCSSFTANWSSVATATSYRLDVSTSPTFASFVSGYSNRDVGLVTSFNVTTGLMVGTTYYYRVRSFNGCSNLLSTDYSTVQNVVTANPSASISGTTTVCQNAASPNITFGNTGSSAITVTYRINSGANQTINVGANTTANVAAPTTTSGTFAYSLVSVAYQSTPTCSTTITGTATITVNPLPSAPKVDTITQPSCTVATGTFQITAYNATRTYTFTPAVISISGTGLVTANPGNYSFTVDNASGCTSLATAVAVDPLIQKTWNGSASTDWNVAANWTPNGIPTINDCVTIPNLTNKPQVLTSNADACTLILESKSALEVKSPLTLTVYNKITIASDANMIFENNASLVQKSKNFTNEGEITYKRLSSPMKNFDFTYWSSPVYGDGIVVPKQTAKNLSPNTLADKYFRFDPTSGWVFDDGEMKPGVGFIIRVPKPNFWPNPAASDWEQPVTFIGVPNNGDINYLNVGPDQFHLIGNPYPSALDADLFISANSSILFGPLYFWTHNTPINNNNYTANDYATYNFTGSTRTALGNFVDANNNGVFDAGEEVISNKPSGKIAAGQSFFVGTNKNFTGTREFQFTNAMRVPGNNDKFFKQTNAKKTTSDEKNRVWLNLTNSQGAFKQLLVGYLEGATNDWDNLYDGPTFDGQPFVDFYSLNQGKKLTIQGRALPFEATDEVPLGYRSTIAGPFDISIDNRDGSLAGQEIWLEDKKTNTLHELSKGKYTFTAINGVENDRFVLKYTGKTLGTDDNEVADKSLIVSVKNKKITLTSSAEAITQVQLFDLLGRKVYDKSKINAQEWSISNLPLSEQTLIVKTTLANGAISNKKIIY